MPLRRWLTPTALMLAMPAAAAWLAWDFYKLASLNGEMGASGVTCAVGTFRINDNGSPQICLKR